MENFSSTNNFHLEGTAHYDKRRQGRGIQSAAVHATIDCGEQRWSHGLLVYTMSDRALQESGLSHDAERLRGLCVVMEPTGRIITVKWLYRYSSRPGVLRGSYRRRQVAEAEARTQLREAMRSH